MSSPVARASLVRRARSSSEPSQTTTLSGVVIFWISSTHRWTEAFSAVMYVSGKVLRLASVEALVRRGGEEFREVLGEDEAVEDLGRFAEPAAASELPELLVADLPVEVGRRRAPVVEPGLVLGPLPELGAGDLGGGRVLHQVEDGGGAVAHEPGVEVLQGDVDVVAEARFGNRAARHFRVRELRTGYRNLAAELLLLVRLLAEHLVEFPGRDLHQVGVRHPGPVESVGRLALLVLARLGERLLVDLRVLARGDERRHPAEGVGRASVAGLDEQLRVGAHERNGHRHLRPVGQDAIATGTELLDDREHVVPAAGVETA